MELSQNAITVLNKRYLIRDEKGNPTEKPIDLFTRVAYSVAEAEKNYEKDEDKVKETAEKFLKIITDLDFLPNSPTLMNAGRPLGQLSACFVLPIADSMDDIFDTLKNTALIHKSGGGTGFSFSRLRPASDTVKSTNGVSSGPVSFMEVFNSATEAIKQGGTRRGANMGCLRVDHPDILEFITCKKDLSKLTNFNISVLVTDKFMEAVKKGGDYELINPRTKKPVKTLNAGKVFDLLINMAWRSGEPGILFVDTVNRANPTPEIGEIESTNPCGEQPLLPYEACNLGSINLAHFVKEGKVDYERLGEVVKTAIRFLDDVIDVNKYPLPKIDEMCRGNRKIGLGIMGWADMLFQMNVAYDSQAGIDLADEVMGFIQDTAHKASEELAETRGNFPYWDKSIYKDKVPMRNAAVTTIAPTGTLSMIASCSGGCEPLFGVAYFKRVMDGTDLVEVNPYFEAVAKKRGFYSKKLMEKISETGSVRDLDEVPDDVKAVFGTALDITPAWHVRMQAAFQRHNDSAVSKTVNFPEDATPEEVREVFELAYDLGCKGCTVYRYGCREGVMLLKGKEEKKEETPAEEKKQVRARPDRTVGTTERITTGCGHLYVTINEDEEGVCEIFTQLGKAGGCASSQLDSIGRLCSLALRSGVELEMIKKHLRGIRCPSPTWGKGGQVTSCADAIGIAIEHYLAMKNGEEDKAKVIEKNTSKQDTMIGACPDCGSPVSHESGCVVCHYCGFSKCS